MISTSDYFTNEETKYWRIVVSHNYDERTKQSSNQEIFMSLYFLYYNVRIRFIRYECDELRDPFHYVIIQIDFGNDVNHAYRFTTFPLLFDMYIHFDIIYLQKQQFLQIWKCHFFT